jgi:hypothetical protein
MITIHLSATDVARTRFAFSPLWECFAAFRAWKLDAREVRRFGWTDLLRAVAPDERWPLLGALALAPEGRIPDFLAPPPPGPFASVERELAGLRAVPPRVVGAELRRFDPELARRLALRTRLDHEAFLSGISSEVASFWRWALAPIWPRLQAMLEADVVYRSRVLAFAGLATLFEGLHESMRFTKRGAGGSLRVPTSARGTRRGGRAGVLLVPSMFAWPTVYAVVRRPWRTTIAYPARGIAELWLGASHPTGTTGTRLAALLGAGRAEVLRTLERPQTTVSLASALRAAPSTVSQHLRRLRDAGIVDRARVGRRVYYVANTLGQGLLRAMSRGVDDRG